MGTVGRCRWRPLALSLAGALSCHYYAVFVFVALGAGGGADAGPRRLDLPVWAAFAAAASCRSCSSGR
jgi:hypothetical protein